MIKLNPQVRRDLIISAALIAARQPGGWIGLTRSTIATYAGVSEGLVSRYLGSMIEARRVIMDVAINQQITEIIVQSRIAHDGYAPVN